MRSGGRIVAAGLTKKYGSTVVVSVVDLTAEPGRITGFLGLNGAGKTTTLRMLVNLATPTAGTATIGGCRYLDLQAPIREVGTVLDSAGGHPRRTGRNHLRALCAAAALPAGRADEVLGLVGLEPDADKAFGSYSLGMKQRLNVAQALLGDPGTLILDEPSNGLDPAGIHWMRELLRHWAAEGRTVLVSSHQLTEMANIAQELVIINQGRIITAGATADVVGGSGPPVVRVRVADPCTFARLLIDIGGTVEAEPDGRLVVSGLSADTVAGAAARSGIPLSELLQDPADLERVFLALTKDREGAR